MEKGKDSDDVCDVILVETEKESANDVKNNVTDIIDLSDSDDEIYNDISSLSPSKINKNVIDYVFNELRDKSVRQSPSATGNYMSLVYDKVTGQFTEKFKSIHKCNTDDDVWNDAFSVRRKSEEKTKDNDVHLMQESMSLDSDNGDDVQCVHTKTTDKTRDKTRDKTCDKRATEKSDKSMTINSFNIKPMQSFMSRNVTDDSKTNSKATKRKSSDGNYNTNNSNNRCKRPLLETPKVTPQVSQQYNQQNHNNAIQSHPIHNNNNLIHVTHPIHNNIPTHPVQNNYAMLNPIQNPMQNPMQNSMQIPMINHSHAQSFQFPFNTPQLQYPLPNVPQLPFLPPLVNGQWNSMVMGNNHHEFRHHSLNADINRTHPQMHQQINLNPKNFFRSYDEFLSYIFTWSVEWLGLSCNLTEPIRYFESFNCTIRKSYDYEDYKRLYLPYLTSEIFCAAHAQYTVRKQNPIGLKIRHIDADINIIINCYCKSNDSHNRNGNASRELYLKKGNFVKLKLKVTDLKNSDIVSDKFYFGIVCDAYVKETESDNSYVVTHEYRIITKRSAQSKVSKQCISVEPIIEIGDYLLQAKCLYFIDRFVLHQQILEGKLRPYDDGSSKDTERDPRMRNKNKYITIDKKLNTVSEILKESAVHCVESQKISVSKLIKSISWRKTHLLVVTSSNKASEDVFTHVKRYWKRVIDLGSERFGSKAREETQIILNQKIKNNRDKLLLPNDKDNDHSAISARINHFYNLKKWFENRRENDLVMDLEKEFIIERAKRNVIKDADAIVGTYDQLSQYTPMGATLGREYAKIDASKKDLKNWFDVCIVMDAENYTEPQLLTLLRYGVKTLILIGDLKKPNENLCRNANANKRMFNSSMIHRFMSYI